MKNYRFIFVIFIAVALIFTACGGPTTQTVPDPTAIPQINLTIAGSGGAATVLKYLADAYTKQHSEMTFEFLSGSSSGGGVSGALDGTLDLGTMSRLPKDS